MPPQFTSRDAIKGLEVISPDQCFDLSEWSGQIFMAEFGELKWRDDLVRVNENIAQPDDAGDIIDPLVDQGLLPKSNSQGLADDREPTLDCSEREILAPDLVTTDNQHIQRLAFIDEHVR